MYFVMTEEEYEAARLRARIELCFHCENEMERGSGLPAPNGRSFCSEKCFERSKIKNAPLVKTKGPEVRVDGWLV